MEGGLKRQGWRKEVKRSKHEIMHLVILAVTILVAMLASRLRH
jgi:hypothetical protein